MRFILAVLVFVVFCNAALSFPSPELKELWDIPTDSVEYEIIDSFSRGSVQVEKIYYQSRLYRGIPAKIFGYYCHPAGTWAKLPAILLSHGGGGTASLERSISWAQRGYAVLAIDLPGKGEQRPASRSTGPDMDVSTILHTYPDLSNNYLVHAVAAARNGITFLCQREEVDRERIGMVGLSWGGVLTLLTNGQDKRLKTAVNVFGAGYIPEGSTWQLRFDTMTNKELSLWNSFIDPKNFLKTQHAPILFITGTNDHCYYLPTFQKSYEEVSASKKLFLIPNLRHRFLEDTESIVFSWLDAKLKYEGSFPEIYLLSVDKKSDDKLIVAAAASTSSYVTNASLHYTPGEPSRWTKRKWESINAYYENGVYYFGVPTSIIKPEMMFYITVKDNKGAAASTPIRSILRVKAKQDKEIFAVSSPIKKIDAHEPPFKWLGMEKLPQLLQVYFSKQTKTYYLINLEEES